MTWPPHGTIAVGVVELRAEPRDDSELVDQAHFGERVRILGEREDWRYIQGEDLYFGWVHADALFVFRGSESRIVAVVLAPVFADPDAASDMLGQLPAGTEIPAVRQYEPAGEGLQREVTNPDIGPWLVVHLRRPGVQNRFMRGYVELRATVAISDVPQRYPKPADYLQTAESFTGVPYLWGGTTAIGMDCSGFVQQVYRLNGVALPRDADQQAMLGREVDAARAGDLMFFGSESVTHVALATSATEFIHAPMKGGVVERGALGGGRTLRGIRRYLTDEADA